MQTKAANEIDVHVGSQIRLRRKSLQITQTMLGERLGITFQQVQKYEKGSNRVGASRLQAIANILGVEVAFFFSGHAPDGLAKPGRDNGDSFALRSFISSHEGFALNRAFFKIEDPQIRRRIIGLVKTLAEHPAASESEI